jgi:hypothetical protein
MNKFIFSFLLSHQESIFEINTNILETNLINILILIGILLYANKVAFSATLENRKKEIIQSVENAQKDVKNASNYFFISEKGFTQTLFWLQLWKNLYQNEKIKIINNQYNFSKQIIENNFDISYKLIETTEKKYYIFLQKYFLLIIASRILRRFLLLSNQEQKRMIEAIILKLGEIKK